MPALPRCSPQPVVWVARCWVISLELGMAAGNGCSAVPHAMLLQSMVCWVWAGAVQLELCCCGVCVHAHDIHVLGAGRSPR